jgi:hypothetical protein
MLIEGMIRVAVFVWKPRMGAERELRMLWQGIYTANEVIRVL